MPSKDDRSSSDQLGNAKPELIGLERLRQPALLGSTGAIAAVGIAAMIWFGAGQSPSDSNTKLISVAGSTVPGAVMSLPAGFNFPAENVFPQLHMSEEEKQRMKEMLKGGRMRIGSITVWDSQAEDGDAVHLAAAGFEQTVPITHKRRNYLLPFYPGGTVRITGTRDGGGGITLGVQTALGPVLLPRLAVGQTMEIAIQ